MNKQKKILIADDEPMHLDFFDLMLSKLGFVVEKARDGQEVLDKLKKFFPDIILLDNMMPRMTGFEVTRILKNDPKFKEIPVLMISAMDDVKDKVEGFELGVDDYITKPFNFYEVLARLKAVLRSRELYTQIVLRESRLSLAEKLRDEMKNELAGFVKNIHELCDAVSAVDAKGGLGKDEASLLGKVSEKSKRISEQAEELNAKVEKAFAEWEDFKKNEVGLPMLERGINKSLKQEYN